MTASLRFNGESAEEAGGTSRRPIRQSTSCRFTKIRNGLSVMIPGDRIQAIDTSFRSGDTLVSTFTGNVAVEESFEESVSRLRRCGVQTCTFVRQGSTNRIAIPLGWIVRVEKSEHDGIGMTLVLTVYGRVCVEGTLEGTAAAIEAAGGDFCAFHKVLDESTTYIMRNAIKGIRVSPYENRTIVTCGLGKFEWRIVVKEPFEEACQIYDTAGNTEAGVE